MRAGSRSRSAKQLKSIGWREFVGLPDLGVEQIKAKVDTGARSSALHATNLRIENSTAFFEVSGGDRGTCATQAEIVTMRRVRSSSGEVEERPLIRTHVALGKRCWKIDVTLTDRSEMGFELLLGREAIRGRLLVDSGRSFLWGSSAGESPCE